jgi:hypothetical protein
MTPVAAVVPVYPVSLSVAFSYVFLGRKEAQRNSETDRATGDTGTTEDTGSVNFRKKRTMTPHKPLSPPLRGSLQHRAAVAPAAAPADTGCTILESCDQCGRRVLRPHVSNGRGYCPACCPTCARAAASTKTF